MYIYFNKQGASVIDYLLLSGNDFNRTKYFRINELNEWSDHAPIIFEVVCEDDKYIKKEKDNAAHTYNWLPENKYNSRGSIIVHLPVFHDIVNSMSVLDPESIHDCVTKFAETVNKLAGPLFSNKIKFNRADWFDYECKATKRNGLIAVYEYNKHKNVQIWGNMCD